MKSFVSFLIVSTIVCISVIHSAPVSLTRNNHRVDEPLGFLTNFILNRRSRVVQHTAVASVGAEGKKRAVENRASTSPRYKNTYWKVSTGTLNGNSRNLPINQKPVVDSVKTDIDVGSKSSPVSQLSLDDLASRNERTVEDTPAEVTPVEEEVLPATVAVAPVIEVVEIVQVADAVVVTEIAPVVSAEASAGSTDGSSVSVATGAFSETVEKESPVKEIEIVSTTTIPNNKVVYVNKSPDFRVTLQVIQVEIDPIDPEPIVEAVAVTPVEVAPAVVEASAGASTSSTDGSSSVVLEASAGASTSSTDGSSTVAEAVAEVVDVVPDDAVTPTEVSVINPAKEAPAIGSALPVVGLLPVTSSLSLDLISAAPYGLKIVSGNLATQSYNAGTETGGVEGVEGSGGEAENVGKGDSGGEGGGSDSLED